MRVKLTKQDMVLELDPCAGGAVSALRHRDLDILRSAPERTGPAFDPLRNAAFVMVPFVGRIHHGKFNCDGASIELHPNMPPEPHAIHGHGWRGAWKLQSQTDDTATLEYEHGADTWPWDYTTQQSFAVHDNRLEVTLSVTNHGRTPMPAGLGWHPYFARENAVLTLPTTHVWTPDEDTGENRPSPVTNGIDLSSGPAVEALNLDTTFTVSAATALIDWPTHSVRMIADPLFSHATVYVPPGEDYFCVEPVSHAPNAVNSALSPDQTGFRSLAPGEKLSGSIELSVTH